MSQPDKLSAPENGFGQNGGDTENKRFSRLDDDFMPAALEVLHRPPAPYSRAMLLFIILFSVFVISWAVVGKMVVVPIDGGLEVQANVLNRDIGFVDTGQAVSVKVDAYPFTRHGDLGGVLEWVGKDSVVDQTLGPVYPVRVSLQQYEVPKEVNGRQGEVSPGMTVTADIRIGRRRIIEYFLGPILRYKDRSLRER